MFGERIVRLRRTQVDLDRYNNPVHAWASVLLPERAAVDPGGSSEPVEAGRAPVVTKPRLFFPGSWPDIVSDDRLIVRGHLYAVAGRPAEWRSPWTGLGGLVVELNEVSG